MVHSNGGTDDATKSFKIGVIDFIGGSLGGIAAVFVSQPLDTVKVKMQAFPGLYKGMNNCLTTTFRKDGIIRGLYAGTTPALLANVAENSVLFAAYGACQNSIAKLQGVENTIELSAFSNALAGFCAAFFSSFTLCPTELVKCQLQALREVQTSTAISGTQQIAYISPFQLTRTIIRENGLRGMFRGLTPTFMREMPGYFFFFGGYEGARELLRKPNQTKDEIGLLRTMAAGSVGGIVLWTVIFPADVVKSRMQVNNLDSSALSVGLNILRQEGFGALYNGLRPTLIRTIPATAVLFVVYEYSKKFMSDWFL